MEKVNLQSFAIQSKKKRKGYKAFITKLENHPPNGLDRMIVEADQQTWKQIDCLSCANCCKKMTPTFTPKDIKRASDFLHIQPKEFKEKWLIYEKKDKDWVNVSQPCQFLDLKTNMCTIYEARPADCAGFPHLAKKKAVDYMHVHKQNLEYCPATLKFIELMKEKVKEK